MGFSKERWLVGVFCPGSHHLLNTSIIIIGIVHAKIIPVLIAEKRIAGANTRMKRMENMPAIFFKERYAYSDLIMKRNCIVIPSMNKSYHIAVPAASFGNLFGITIKWFSMIQRMPVVFPCAEPHRGNCHRQSQIFRIRDNTIHIDKVRFIQSFDVSRLFKRVYSIYIVLI